MEILTMILAVVALAGMSAAWYAIYVNTKAMQAMGQALVNTQKTIELHLSAPVHYDPKSASDSVRQFVEQALNELLSPKKLEQIIADATMDVIKKNGH